MTGTEAVFFSLFAIASAIPNGAPLAACATFTPVGHVGSSAATCDESPFGLNVIAMDTMYDDEDVYANATYRITIGSTSNTMRGFLVQGEYVNGGITAETGSFINLPMAVADTDNVYAICGACGEDGADGCTSATHNQMGAIREDFSTVSVYWTAPETDDGGAIQFRYTAVEVFSTWYGPCTSTGDIAGSDTGTTRRIITESTSDVLIPYGESFHDLVLPHSSGDTPIQDQFDLPIPIPYFGTQENTLYVTSNGLVSLGEEFIELNGSPFPFGTVPIIAPFWANINTEITGEVLYRLTNNQTLIDEVTSYTNDAFDREFSPEMLFVVTWDNVVEYTDTNSTLDQFNTFQLALTTDGNATFVLFLYGDIQWTSGFTNIGFNSRSSDSFYNLPDSAIDLETLSNIGSPGVFVFRVDQETIQLPATTSATTESIPDDNTAVITGSVIGSISFVLLVVIILVVCSVRRYKTKVKQSSRLPSNDESLPAQSKGEDFNLLRVKSAFDPHLSSSMIVNSCNLKLGNCIGEGEFGIVYKSSLKARFNENVTETVAVKTLKTTGTFSTELVIDLLKECAKMKEFDHPNVLNLKGVCLDGGPVPYIIMPFMTNGSLQSYLKENRESLVIDPSSTDPNDVLIIQKKLLDMCIQVAKGMEYLASKRIIHRDLAARNCMIDFGFVIKVADFGLSESLDTSKEYFREVEGDMTKLPIKWLALESITDRVFSEKTDVWAFGVTCWEVVSGGKIPYPDIHPMELVHQLETGYRMKKPVNIACSDEMYGIVSSCWEKSPESRPHFSHLVITLSTILTNIAEYFDLAGSDQATNVCGHDTA